MSTNGGSGGCGCGGGCGGGGGVVAATGMSKAAGYVRPLFFAGQLLTEEDLELLGEYVTAKNRLHNRSFLGEGVVCGLEVLCHPCGEGKVLVRPGYALDCCGNDIVVPCEEELDINAMVHRLRVEQLGGWDCGDPCDQPDGKDSATPYETNGKGEEEAERMAVAPGKELDVKKRRTGRRYSLYVRYTEEVADPVAPYATDEPCGDEGCKPSRIREGYEFKLRCPEDPAEPDDFLARARKCYEAVERLRGWGKKKSHWNILGGRIPAALHEYRAAEANFTEADAKAMVSSSAALREFADRAEEEPDPETVRRRLDDLRAVVMASSRFHALPEEERRVALERYENLAEASDEASEAAKLAAEAIAPHVDAAVDDEVERSMARALIAETPRFTDRELILEAREDPRLYLAMEGTPMNVLALQRQEESLMDLKSWLLARLDSADLTDCSLRRDVERINVAQPSNEIRPERLSLASEAGRRLALALYRYAFGCICRNVLPPCRPCDDMDVLLATVEVDECEVVHVCNLERRIPLTGNALDYWLPMDGLRRWLDQTCCEGLRKLAEWEPAKPEKPEQPEQPPPAATPEIYEMTAIMRVEERDKPIFRVSEEERETASVASMLSVAGLPPEHTDRIARTIGDVSALRSVRNLVAAPAAAPAPTPEEAEAEHEKEVADVADVAATAAAEAVERVAERRLEKVELRLKELTEVKRDVTTLRKRSEDLKRRNSDLEKRNRALEKRVEKLSGGG